MTEFKVGQLVRYYGSLVGYRSNLGIITKIMGNESNPRIYAHILGIDRVRNGYSPEKWLRKVPKLRAKIMKINNDIPDKLINALIENKTFDSYKDFIESTENKYIID